MLSAMISYSRKDEEFVKDFYEKLKQAGVDVWIDTVDIPEGEVWREAIYKAVLSHDAMIMFLSKNYLASEICRLETFLAVSYGKRVLPLMIDPCWEELYNHDETISLAERIILDYSGQKLFGLPMTDDERFGNVMAVLSEDDAPDTPEKAYVVFPNDQSEFAARIADDLREADIPTWMASRSFFVGDSFNRAWPVLRDAEVLIPILTHRIVDDDAYFMTKEVLLGRIANLKLFPVIAPDYATDRMSLEDLRDKLRENFETMSITEINWFNPQPSYDEMLGNLVAAIKKST